MAIIFIKKHKKQQYHEAVILGASVLHEKVAQRVKQLTDIELPVNKRI
jgi:hypothetical protein